MYATLRIAVLLSVAFSSCLFPSLLESLMSSMGETGILGIFSQGTQLLLILKLRRLGSVASR